MSDSEDENDNTVDCDVCSVEELGSAFKTAYTLASEEALSLKKIYILHLDHSRYENIELISFGFYFTITDYFLLSFTVVLNESLQQTQIIPLSFMIYRITTV